MVGWRQYFLPGTAWRRRWDLCNALLTFWYALELPFRMAFYYYDLNEFVLGMFPFFDSFFIIDLIMWRNYFPLRDIKSGLLVMDK